MTLKKKRLVTNIVFYVLIALLYGFVIFMLITKLNGNTVYLFDVRYDVVLTDSMSVRNENHLDFLEGTTQIQPYDMVRSRKVDDNTDLKLKDVILFKNPELGGRTTMHRIAEIVQKSSTFTVVLGKETTFEGNKTIELKEYGSRLDLEPVALYSIELTYLSNYEESDDYSFFVGSTTKEHTSLVEQKGSYYIHKVTCLTGTTGAMPTQIYPNTLGKAFVTNVTYTKTNGKTFSISSSEYVEPVEGNYETQCNYVDYYKTRGDKAKDFDNGGDLLARSEIYARVERVLPKLGYAIKFFTSIPGIILFIGLAIIITVGSYFYNRSDKKDKNKAIEASTTAVEENIEEKKGAENDQEEKN